MTEENSISSTENEESVEVIHNLNLEVPKGRYCMIASSMAEAKVHHLCVAKHARHMQTKLLLDNMSQLKTSRMRLH